MNFRDFLVWNVRFDLNWWIEGRNRMVTPNPSKTLIFFKSLHHLNLSFSDLWLLDNFWQLHVLYFNLEYFFEEFIRKCVHRNLKKLITNFRCKLKYSSLKTCAKHSSAYSIVQRLLNFKTQVIKNTVAFASAPH